MIDNVASTPRSTPVPQWPVRGRCANDDVTRFASLTRGPATQHPAVHSGDQRLRILPDDRGRLLQGLHDVTSAQDRCQGATQKIRSLDGRSGPRCPAVCGVPPSTNRTGIVRAKAARASPAATSSQHAGPGMGPSRSSTAFSYQDARMGLSE